jgi:hypothetical protein
MPPLFRPGKLTTLKSGLLLSEGLDARIIATANQVVPYDIVTLLEDGVTFVDRSSNHFTSDLMVELRIGIQTH